MTMKRLTSLLCGGALVLCMGLMIGAQEVTSTIVGTVVDSSGAVVPGATVKLTDVGTNVVRTASSGQDGVFHFPNLAAHTYNATITANGFQAKTITAIILGASSTRDLGKVAMTVGNVSQEVTVTAAATPIQTSSSEVSHTIQGSALDSLPLVGRDVFGALKLDAGVVSHSNYDVVSENDIGSITIDGNTSAKNFTVDGVTDLDTGSNGTTHYEPNEDAIQEVKILSSNYDAEYGRNSGGTITVITKSGTNKFHGSGWANHRQEEFNANTFFNNATGKLRPQYRYNIDGWSFGGPVDLGWLKNKLYFFGSQEYTNQKGSTTTEDVITPTALERTGDFSQSKDKNGNLYTIKDPRTGVQFPGNVIPAAGGAACGISVTCVNPAGQAMLNFFPQPNYTGSGTTLGYNYQDEASAAHPHRNDVMRIDFDPTSKLTAYFRWIRDVDDMTSLFNGQPFNIAPIDHPNPGHGYAWSGTYVLSPTLINTVTVGKSWNTWSWYFLPGSLAQVSNTALTVAPPSLFALPTTPAGVNGYANLLPAFSFGTNRASAGNMMSHSVPGTYNYYNANNIWTVNDDVSKVLGAHQLKTGVYVEYNTKLQPAGNGFAGNYNFATDSTNPNNTGDGFANAVVGNFDSYTQQTARTVFNVSYWNVEFYGQDSWRATRKLNIDLGLRFYHQTPQVDQNHTFSTFVPSLYVNQQKTNPAFSKGILYVPACTVTTGGSCGTKAGQNGGTVQSQDPNTLALGPAAYIGAFLPGVNTADGLQVPGTNGLSADPYTNKSLVVAPRIGFAYDVYGNGKTAIRGGFGVFYNRLDGNQVYNMSGQAPTSYTYSVSQSSLATLAAAPAGSLGVIAPSNINFYSGVTPIPVVKNASLGVEQELGHQTSLDVSYVGNFSTDQPVRSNQNPVPLGANFNTANNANLAAATGQPATQDGSSLLRTKYPGMLDLNQEIFQGHSNYNALQVTVQHQLSNGVLFGAAYSWSRDLGVTGYDPLMTLGAPYQSNDGRNYGLLSANRDQSLVVNYSWQLPGVGNNLAGAVLNHWTFAGLATVTTGAPFGPSFNTGGVDYTGSTSEGPRPQQVSNPLANIPAGDIFNPAAFVPPTALAGSATGIGNVGSNPFTYPGYWDADMSITKFIPVGFTEGSGFSLQVQAYNVFNHAQFNGFGTNLNNAGYGVATGTQEARILAFNLRYSF